MASNVTSALGMNLPSKRAREAATTWGSWCLYTQVLPSVPYPASTRDFLFIQLLDVESPTRRILGQAKFRDAAILFTRGRTRSAAVSSVGWSESSQPLPTVRFAALKNLHGSQSSGTAPWDAKSASRRAALGSEPQSPTLFLVKNTGVGRAKAARVLARTLRARRPARLLRARTAEAARAARRAAMVFVAAMVAAAKRRGRRVREERVAGEASLTNRAS